MQLPPYTIRSATLVALAFAVCGLVVHAGEDPLSRARGIVYDAPSTLSAQPLAPAPGEREPAALGR